MFLQYAKNPVWANSEQTTINLLIKWDNFKEELPFTADPNDCEQHGRDIFALALAGNFGEIAGFHTTQEPKIFPTAPSGEISQTIFE